MGKIASSAAVAVLLLLLAIPRAYAADTSMGEVQKVDASKNVLVLSTECDCGSGKIIQMSFTLKDATKISLNGKDAKLSEIKQGDKVEIVYEQIDDVTRVSATRDG